MYLQAKEWTAILSKTKKEKPTEKFYSESEEEEEDSASTSATGRYLEMHFHLRFLDNFMFRTACYIRKKKKNKAHLQRYIKIRKLR